MSLNVLVVDDSPVMRRMVRRSLGMCGLSVGEIYEAGDGAEALALLEARWIDVVIADINMPSMNGIEMVETMAKDNLLAHVPVIMVSSDRSEARVEQMKGLGVRGYLTKPFRPEAFREVVESLLPICSGLKAEPSTALLAEVTAKVLEECVFILARPQDQPTSFPEPVVQASIAFDGPAHGKLTTAASLELATEVSASMLGMDPSEPDVAVHVDAALSELSNILCGVLVERLFGREVTCRIGLPEVTRGPAIPAPIDGVFDVILLDDQQRPFRVTLEVRRAAPHAAKS